jgi:hypothetical protein
MNKKDSASRKGKCRIGLTTLTTAIFLLSGCATAVKDKHYYIYDNQKTPAEFLKTDNGAGQYHYQNSTKKKDIFSFRR